MDSKIIFNPRGLPWTVGLGFGWTVILAVVLSGVLFLPLGLYLAYWVRTRQGHSAGFWCYVLAIVALLLTLMPRVLSGAPVDVIGAIAVVSLVVAPLVLRVEIKSLYQRYHGVNLPINPLLTILFSSVYLNWHLLDLPIPASASSTPHAKSAGQ